MPSPLAAIPAATQSLNTVVNSVTTVSGITGELSNISNLDTASALSTLSNATGTLSNTVNSLSTVVTTPGALSGSAAAISTVSGVTGSLSNAITSLSSIPTSGALTSTSLSTISNTVGILSNTVSSLSSIPGVSSQLSVNVAKLATASAAINSISNTVSKLADNGNRSNQVPFKNSQSANSATPSLDLLQTRAKKIVEWVNHSFIGNGSFLDYINDNLLTHQEQPDVSGYTFVFLEPPDLSGLIDKSIQQNIDEICKKSLFLAIDATPPSVTINTEQINTQASISMPYATTKIATGNLSITFIDNSVMDINSMHNVWIEYIYNQLWGDLKPAAKYLDPNSAEFGSLDYATSAFIVKYDPTFSDPPVMVGKATGIFPTTLPVKEVIGTRSNRELVMESITYTCSYYEVVHPKSMVQIYSTNDSNKTILDELVDRASKRYK